MKQFASRKFLLTVLCLLLSFGAMLMGKLEGAYWVSLVLGLVVTHHAANVVTKHVTSSTTTSED